MSTSHLLTELVETCIRLGEEGQTVTDSTCEAAGQCPKYTGPSLCELLHMFSASADFHGNGVPCLCMQECPFAGGSGCIAMTNLD